MEAFLYVKRRKEEEKCELEFTKKTEATAENMKKEPWDDNDDYDMTTTT
jgi:hypothetical protein